MNQFVKFGHQPDNTLPAGVPNGYLKAVFFDKAGNVQVAESQVKYLQTSVSSWQTLELSFTASQNGYLQVYVANESDQEVFFDELEVAHPPTLIAQENHYYPYGMNMVGMEKQGMPHHRFQYNAGAKRETSFHLHWDETPFRRYDAQLGRFHGVDALASQFAGITPYQYAFNNPVMFNDPTGLLPDATASFGDPTTFMDEYFNGQAGGDHLQNNFGEEYSYDWSTGDYVNGIGQVVSSHEAIGGTESVAAQSGELYRVLRSSYPAVLAALRKAVTTPTDEGGKGSEGQMGLNSDEGNNLNDIRFRDSEGNLIGTIKTDLVDKDISLSYIPGVIGNLIGNMSSPVVITAPATAIAGEAGAVDATGFGIVFSGTALGGAHIGLEFVFFHQGPDKGKYDIYAYTGGNFGLDLGVSVYGLTANYKGPRNEITRDSWLGLFYSLSASYKGLDGNVFWGQTLYNDWVTPFYPGMNGEITWRGSSYTIWSKSIPTSLKFSVSDYKYARDFFKGTAEHRLFKTIKRLLNDK